MKPLANENIPLGMVHRLREMGHDVLAIVQSCPGVTDAVVLDLARREQRTLLTFDRDYGELVYDVLSMLSSGMSQQEIQDDFPELTSEDILAVLAYAADREHQVYSLKAH